jgi:hypothetical protein
LIFNNYFNENNYFYLSDLQVYHKSSFNKIDHAGTFTEYQTKSGGVLKINDTITIGYPLVRIHFFLTQGDLNVATT